MLRGMHLHLNIAKITVDLMWLVLQSTEELLGNRKLA